MDKPDYDPEEDARARRLEKEFHEWDFKRMEELANQYRQLEQEQADAERALEELSKSIDEAKAAIEAEIGPFLAAITTWMVELTVWWEEQMVPVLMTLWDNIKQWVEDVYSILVPEEEQEPYRPEHPQCKCVIVKYDITDAGEGEEADEETEDKIQPDSSNSVEYGQTGEKGL